MPSRRRSRAVDLDELGDELKRFVEQRITEDHQVLREVVAADVAHRTLAHVAEVSLEVRRDQGEYHRGWETDRTSEGWDVWNSVPYAGVIELGRRPMRPGPPLAPILEWVQRRHPELDEDEAMRIAVAAREDIHRNGTPPMRILGDTVDTYWSRWLAEAVELHLAHRSTR